MNKIAFITAVAFAAIPAMAQDAPTQKEDCADKCCCAKDTKACCDKAAKAKAAKCGASECCLDIETVTLEAANGDPLAQYTIAWLTDTGNGVEQDTAKAADWYGKALPGLEKAAETGHPGACLALARMYAEGKGVEKNVETARKYMDMYKACCGKCQGKPKAEATKAEAPAS